jgi:hypothetical protein
MKKPRLGARLFARRAHQARAHPLDLLLLYPRGWLPPSVPWRSQLLPPLRFFFIFSASPFQSGFLKPLCLGGILHLLLINRGMGPSSGPLDGAPFWPCSEPCELRARRGLASARSFARGVPASCGHSSYSQHLAD